MIINKPPERRRFRPPTAEESARYRQDLARLNDFSNREWLKGLTGPLRASSKTKGHKVAGWLLLTLIDLHKVDENGEFKLQKHGWFKGKLSPDQMTTTRIQLAAKVSKALRETVTIYQISTALLVLDKAGFITRRQARLSETKSRIFLTLNTQALLGKLAELKSGGISEFTNLPSPSEAKASSPGESAKAESPSGEGKVGGFAAGSAAKKDQPDRDTLPETTRQVIELLETQDIFLNDDKARSRCELTPEHVRKINGLVINSYLTPRFLNNYAAWMEFSPNPDAWWLRCDLDFFIENFRVIRREYKKSKLNFDSELHSLSNHLPSLDEIYADLLLTQNEGLPREFGLLLEHPNKGSKVKSIRTFALTDTAQSVDTLIFAEVHRSDLTSLDPCLADDIRHYHLAQARYSLVNCCPGVYFALKAKGHPVDQWFNLTPELVAKIDWNWKEIQARAMFKENELNRRAACLA
jgi:hypothetical protein